MLVSVAVRLGADVSDVETIPGSSVLPDDVLRSLGVMNHQMLEAAVAEAPPQYVWDGLIQEQSVNLVVGNSGLGKTPLLVGLGLAVASGTSFLQHAVRQGPVLYCDGEMGRAEFLQLERSLSTHLGLSAPPANMLTFSPNWSTSVSDVRQQLAKQIAAICPVLVIVDPVRAFFLAVEGKAADSEALIQWQRKLAKAHGCAWVNLHHRRKPNTNALEAPSLVPDPRGWFTESAGSYALVNHSDLRLGVDDGAGEADIILGGFVRGQGPLAPIRLAREHDDGGAPVGYRVLSGIGLLSADQQAAFTALSSPFTFTQAQAALGTKSGSKTTAFIAACIAAALISAEGEGKKKKYNKVM